MTDLDALAAQITVNDAIGNQPIGGWGFRTGKWKYLYRGEIQTVFTSVPHTAALDQQYAIVRYAAARQILKSED